MLKLTFILSSLSMEPIAAGMPQTFRASTRILPTGRLENHYWAAHQQQERLKGEIGLGHPLSGLVVTIHMINDMSLDSFVFFFKQLYTDVRKTSSVFMTCPARKTFFSCLHNSSMHCNLWVTLSFNHCRFYFKKLWGAVEQVLIWPYKSFERTT